MPPPIHIACLGDSITQGAGTTPDPEFTNAYPAQLQRMLAPLCRAPGDPTFIVHNFGVGGTTLLQKGDSPYLQTSAFEDALALKPSIALIMLGTNDTKPWNWKHKRNFSADYHHLLTTLQSLPSKPKLYLLRPPFIPNDGVYGINQPTLTELLSLLDTLARTYHLPLIDVHTATRPHPEAFPDNVHPNNAGANIIAQTVYQALIGRPYQGPSVVR